MMDIVYNARQTAARDRAEKGKERRRQCRKKAWQCIERAMIVRVRAAYLLRHVKLNGAVLVLVLKDGQRREARCRHVAEVVKDDLVLLQAAIKQHKMQS